MFLDWLERRVDPFAPFDEARMPPRSVLGFAWFYLRPIRAALAALFGIAVIAGTVEADRKSGGVGKRVDLGGCRIH